MGAGRVMDTRGQADRTFVHRVVGVVRAGRRGPGERKVGETRAADGGDGDEDGDVGREGRWAGYGCRSNSALDEGRGMSVW